MVAVAVLALAEPARSAQALVITLLVTLAGHRTPRRPRGDASGQM